MRGTRPESNSGCSEQGPLPRRARSPLRRRLAREGFPGPGAALASELKAELGRQASQDIAQRSRSLGVNAGHAITELASGAAASGLGECRSVARLSVPQRPNSCGLSVARVETPAARRCCRPVRRASTRSSDRAPRRPLLGGAGQVPPSRRRLSDLRVPLRLLAGDAPAALRSLDRLGDPRLAGVALHPPPMAALRQRLASTVQRRPRHRRRRR